MVITAIYMLIKQEFVFGAVTALQIRAGQRSITTNIWPLTAHIYHVIIIVTGGFSKKSFFHYYLFLRNSFERS